MTNNIEKHGRPLLEAIAQWERENGSVCGILPSEHASLVAVIEKAALGLYTSARGAVDPDPITLYADECGFTFMDFPDHVLLQDGTKHVVLVSTVFDDGEVVGPENNFAVCPNIEEAHKYIDRRFNGYGMKAERVDVSPLSSYRLFFNEEAESDMTIFCKLIPWEQGQ